jgi:hypothetical protein
LHRLFAKGSGRDSEASSGSFDLGMLRLLWDIIGHATSEITMMLPNKPDAANECRAGLLASSDVGRAALIADLGRSAPLAHTETKHL